MTVARSRREITALLRGLWRRPAAFVLPMGGLAIVIVALVAAVALAERGRRRTLATLRQMGADVLIVSAEPAPSRGGRARTGDVVQTLTRADARALRLAMPSVRVVAAERRGTEPVHLGDLARSTTIGAVDASYATLRDAPVAAGRFFTPVEEAGAQRVAVLGARLTRALAGDRNPVGQVVWIRRMPFTIVGVLPERGTGLDAFDEDEVVFVPLRTTERRLFPIAYVERIFLRVDVRQPGDLAATTDALTALLRQRHRPAPGEPPDFRIEGQQRLVTTQRTAASRLGLFEGLVTVALLVAGTAGTAIMQWLAVAGRQAEIGTRRALGATQGTIMRGMLVESTVIHVAGAVLGGLASLAVTRLLAAPAPPRLIPLAAAAVVGGGLLAALVPARRASALSPAVAMRAS